MLDQYLTLLQSSYTSSNSIQLSQLLNPFPSSTRFNQLRQSLLSIPKLRTSTFKDLLSTRFGQPQQRPFLEFVANYLVYVRDTPIPCHTVQDLDKTYRLLEDLYKTGDRLFATSENGYFVPTLRLLTTQLIKTSLLMGKQSGDVKLTRAGEAARLLSRPIGIACSDRSTDPLPGIPAKRSALYHLANSTFLVYFSLKNLRLCDTILSNVSNSGILVDGEEFGKGDKCGYWYYRGRIHLYQRRLRLAKNDLGKSFGVCWNRAKGNARLILIYWITASVLVGYFPRMELLDYFGLRDQFGEGLLLPLKKGNWRGVLAHLDRYKEWHLKHGNYLVLREKLELICWRNLFRQTLLINTNSHPLPTTGGPPTLSLSLVVSAARIAWPQEEDGGQESLDLDDLESIAVSLMDQGYVKAYIMHSKRILVLQKGENFGFPPLSSVG
ncbi:hypothetical protein JCM5353_005406 [Sporobolomyces roseus]